MPVTFVEPFLHHAQSLAHAIAPVNSAAFEVLAWMSLGGYLVFAVVALQYALRAWAEKVMFVAIANASAVSLTLHFSLQHSPSYVGEGALWKFVSVSQYLPWAVLSVGGVYLLYRLSTWLLHSRRADHH